MARNIKLMGCYEFKVGNREPINKTVKVQTPLVFRLVCMGNRISDSAVGSEVDTSTVNDPGQNLSPERDMEVGMATPRSVSLGWQTCTRRCQVRKLLLTVEILNTCYMIQWCLPIWWARTKILSICEIVRCSVKNKRPFLVKLFSGKFLEEQNL